MIVLKLNLNLKYCIAVILLIGLICLMLFKKQQFESPKKNVDFDEEYFNKIEGRNKEKYIDSIVMLLQQNKENDSIVRDLYLKAGAEYYYLNNLKKSFSSSLIAFNLSKEKNDSSRMAKSLYYLGDCYENSHKDSAYYYYLQAQKIYAKIHDYDHLGRMYFNKAYVLFFDGRFVECEVEVTKALLYVKKTGNTKLQYMCNTLMGNCLEKLFMYDQALKYHQLGLEDLKLMKKDHLDRDQVNNFNVSSVINICNLYDLKGEYSKSIKELNTVLTNDLKNKWPRIYANVLSNLAYSKMKNKEYDNVESMFLESLKIVDSLGYDSDVLYKKIHLGEFYLTQNDTLKSIKILKEAYTGAVEIRNTNEVLSILKLLSKIDRNGKIYYANQYINVSDSINRIQSRTSNKYARIEYETASVEDENKILTKKNFYILIFSFVLFLILSGIFVIIYLKYKNRELRFLKQQQIDNDEIFQLLSEQKEKINSAKEEEKNKIARELHDGVMNKVYAVRMNLGFFNSKTDEKTIEKRKEYIFELQNIENEIRTISHDLSRDSFLEGSDFNILLSDLIKNQSHINGAEFNYIIEDGFDWSKIQNVYKVNFYRIIQESLLNVHKYSSATKVNIEIQLIKNKILKLSIKDNGVGFDVNVIKKGIGLSNIKERTNSLKGHFEINSIIDVGTEVMITFDLSVSQ